MAKIYYAAGEVGSSPARSEYEVKIRSSKERLFVARFPSKREGKKGQ